MSIIKVDNLCKSYGHIDVLRNVSLEIDKGDVVAVLGPSGSGKTTLLRCMNFLERSNEGSFTFGNHTYDMSHIKHKEIAEIRKKTGFVFQSYNLFANKTALENVMLGLTVARKTPKRDAEEMAMKMLIKVGLGDRADRYPIQLSGGQQQRIAIARALATKPEIIYFDEPTSALDPELIGEVLKVIRELANEGMTMVVVTHEMNFARNVSNKIIFMDDGRIIEVGEPEEFFTNPKDERARSFIQNISTQHEV